MIVTIFDYGAGNLHSLAKAITAPNVEVRIEPDPKAAVSTDVLVLPGVGAFSAASEKLAAGLKNMRDALKDGLPCLGICLGMQLLLDESEEGPGSGIGLIPGRVRKLKAERIPQIGWNKVEASLQDPRHHTLPAVAYFANSYVCEPADNSSVVAWTEHEGDRFPSAVRKVNTVGVQFHPEKSSSNGVQFIKEFIANAGNTSR